MKNLSLILNAILIAAVGFLFFKVYSGDKSKTQIKVADKSANSASAAKPMIAYVELDSLNEHIVYIKQKRQSLEAEQKAIESEWTSGMRGLEAQRDNFIKRGNSITQEEAEKFQAQLMQQQQTIEAKKQNSAQKLSEKSYKMMEDIQKNLKDYLSEYNKAKGYTYILTTGTGLDYMIFKDSTLDITADVIAGMNERLKDKK